MSHASRFALAVSVTSMALAILNCGSEDEPSPEGAISGSPPGSIVPSGRDGGSPPVTMLPGPGPSPGPAGTANGSDASAADASATDAKKPDAAKVDSGSPPPSGTPGDPCATVTCAAGEACVPYAHGQPLGACVATCDCSNCGNCGGDNADSRWNDQQEYCGNRASSPATMACNNPCQGGMGCIPFGSVNICWPLEGCFSL